MLLQQFLSAIRQVLCEFNVQQDCSALALTALETVNFSLHNCQMLSDF